MMEYIITYVFTCLSFIFHMCFYKFIKNRKIKYSRIFIILFLSLISFLFAYLNKPIISLIVNLALSFINIKFIFEISAKEAVYFTIIINLMSMFVDCLMSVLLGKSDLNFFEKYYQNYIFRAALVIPMNLITFILLVNKYSKLIINKIYDKFISKVAISKKFIVFISFIVLAFILFCCINAYENVNSFGHLLLIICITIFVILFIILIGVLYRDYQFEIVNKRIIDENNYIKSIAKQDEEFKHNLVNNLLGIKTVSNNKTNKLIDELINDYKQEYKNLTNINDLPNGIQSIIYRKAYEENIEDLNLIVDNSITKELYNILNAKKYNHLCTAIGILFDNALEAVKYNNEKAIEINFLEDNENIYFILKNSFSNFIDLEELGSEKFTTKTKGHGIGVNYIKKLKTLELKNEIINNMFVSKIIIKKTKKI